MIFFSMLHSLESDTNAPEEPDIPEKNKWIEASNRFPWAVTKKKNDSEVVR